MKRLPLLTNSSAKTFRRCQREYRFRYVDGYVSTRESESLAFGTLIHGALEVWFGVIQEHQSDEVPADKAFGSAIAWLMDAAPKAGIAPDALVRARCMMALYHERWFEETVRDYEVLSIEREFTAPLVNPDTNHASKTFQRAGKMDLMVRHRASDRILVGEHKTSSEAVSPGSAYWAKLTLDGQVSTYLDGARSLGFERIDGCLYDVLVKPRHRPLLATPEELRKYTQPTKKDPEPRLYANQRAADETLEEYEERLLDEMCKSPDDYVRRGIIVRHDDEAKEAAFDDWQTAQSIRAAELSGRWPRNTDNCLRFNRKCDYFGICTHTDTFDSGNFRKEGPHRELPQQQQPQELRP